MGAGSDGDAETVDEPSGALPATSGSIVTCGATPMGTWALPQLAQKLAETLIAAPHCSQNMVSFIVLSVAYLADVIMTAWSFFSFSLTSAAP